MNGWSMSSTDKKHMVPTIEDIFRVRELLDGCVRKTPLQRSDTFSRLTGTNIFLKLEISSQNRFEFKVRGALNKVTHYQSDRENMALLPHLLVTTHKELHMQQDKIMFTVNRNATKCVTSKSIGYKIIWCKSGSTGVRL